MPLGQFIKGLSILILICLALTGITFFIPALHSHISFSIITISLFALLSLTVYYIGNNLATSSNKYLYNNLIIINVMLKIVISVAAILVYVKLMNPTNNWYLLIFILIYILFTIFEVYFMTKQAKTRK